MWKIKRTENGPTVVLSVCGRIEAEQLAELQKIFAAETQEVTLDLKEVKLVDQDAVNFLARCQAQGTKLANCPGYIREWIARGETRCETPEA
jgi:Zn finger protein HypA/HybF involved in hydrogenase expression